MNRNTDSLDREKAILSPGVLCLLLTLITAAGLLFSSAHSVWRQLMLLTHLLSATAFVLICLPYLPVHFRRTAFVRRPMLIVTGLLLMGALAALIGSGIAMVDQGLTRDLAWVGLLHQWMGIGLALLLIAHLADHALRMPERRVQQNGRRFMTVDASLLQRAALGGLLTTGLLVGLSVGLADRTEVQPAEAAVADYQLPYGEHPFRPSQTETVHGGFVSKAESGQSEDCANCHEDIYLQWQSSVHRQAASDPAYVTNINLLVDNKDIAAARYCEGCHAPVALLTGELSEGGEHGGIAGSMGNREGVSCRSCHGVYDMAHLKGVASYRYRPATPYLFENAENPVLRAVNHLLVRIDPEQHRTDLGNPLLADPKFCAGCHAQFMDEDMNDWGWVKMQDEYSAWLNSPFSAHEKEFSGAEPVLCRDCHMPLVASSDPAAGADGLVRSHYFPGANTVLPLINGDEEQLERTLRYLQANNLRVTIDRPNREDSRQDQRTLDESIRGSGEAPFYAYLGEQVSLNVIVSNRGVGHDFPAGTIDLGEAWLELSVTDGSGRLVYQRGGLDAEGLLVADSHAYKSIPVDRGGKEVWKHDLFNMVGESFRRVIPAGESDLVDHAFTVPPWAKSPLTVSATLRYRKLNERYARFALGDDYQPVPVVDMAWDSLSIPLRIRSEVELLSLR